jgi:hypothetical protein
MNPRTLLFAATFALALAAAPACEVPTVSSPGDADRDSAPSDTPIPSDAGDTATDTALGGPGAFCEPLAEVTGCKPGLSCDNRIDRCVECLIFEQRCNADGVRETCEQPSVAADGALRGGVFTETPCGVREACVPLGTTAAECQPIVCEPDFATCVSGGVRRFCNSYGTVETEETCQPGRACYEGRCEFIRHNVLLVFDTSGSMYDYVDPNLIGSPIQCEQNGTPCLEPFPTCDSRTNPLTLFNLSKKIYSEVIQQTIGGYSQFALQRFPQRESATNNANCWIGWYLDLADSRMTGDDDTHDTTLGTWFSDNLGEVVVVPFPSRNNRDNSASLLDWLDNDERLGATDIPCTTTLDCGTGRCGTVDGQRRCFVHADPELRAGGETPLGKSIFYAGEYIRRFVRVDGKPCTTDASCGSAGYVCRNDACVDPYRQCKDDFIILFTDGEESHYSNDTEFFNPEVQAKRLAFGLSCDTAADCRGGATCVDNLCVGTGQLRVDVPAFATDAAMSRALTNPWGYPVSVRTTVITLNELSTKNAEIAYAGGGQNLVVSASEPDVFKQKLRQVTSPDFKCQPEDLP